MQDEILRSHLISLLKGGNAHMTFDDAVHDFPLMHINTTFPKGTYSPWHLLEHIRIAQYDILDFIRNQDYKELEWPKDYWPSRGRKATERNWRNTVRAFHRDSAELWGIVSDPETDLCAEIAHGTGQTVLREILLVADHNAYHIGEFAIMRQVMGTWGKGHM